MKRCAVIGASSGTGRQIATLLAGQGVEVRAISRTPLPAEANIEPYAADATDPQAMLVALDGAFDAVFFTVDIHGKKLSRDAVRAVMYDGCANAIAAAKAGKAKRFVLLSVIGAHRGSWVWWILNALKPGMSKNIRDRELLLEGSGVPYVICRAPRLNDGASNAGALAGGPATHRLNMKRGISRVDLAKALVRAAEAAPAGTSWDVFSERGGPVPSWLG